MGGAEHIRVDTPSQQLAQEFTKLNDKFDLFISQQLTADEVEKRIKAEIAESEQRIETRIADVKNAADARIVATEHAMLQSLQEIKEMFGQFKTAQGDRNRLQEDALQKMAAANALMASNMEQINHTMTNIHSVINTQQQQTGGIQASVKSIDEKTDAHDRELFDVNERGMALARAQDAHEKKHEQDIAVLKNEQVAARAEHTEDIKKIYIRFDELNAAVAPMHMLATRTLKREERYKKGANAALNLCISFAGKIFSRAGFAGLSTAVITKFFADHKQTIIDILFGG